MQFLTSLLLVSAIGAGCCLADSIFDDEYTTTTDIGTGIGNIGGGYRNLVDQDDQDVGVVRHFGGGIGNSIYRNNPFTTYSRSNYRNPLWSRMMNTMMMNKLMANKFGGVGGVGGEGVFGGHHSRLESFFRTFLSWLTPAQKMELRQMKAMGADRRELVRRVVDFFINLPMGSDRQQKAVLLLQSACNRMAEVVFGGRQNLWLLKKKVIQRNGGMMVSPVTMNRVIEQLILERIEDIEGGQQQDQDVDVVGTTENTFFNNYYGGSSGYGYGSAGKHMAAKRMFREYAGLCRVVAKREEQLLKLGFSGLWNQNLKLKMMMQNMLGGSGYGSIGSTGIQGYGSGSSIWPWQKKWWQTKNIFGGSGYGKDQVIDDYSNIDFENTLDEDYTTTGNKGYGIDSLSSIFGGRKHGGLFGGRRFNTIFGGDSSVEDQQDMDSTLKGYYRNPSYSTNHYGSNIGSTIFGKTAAGKRMMGSSSSMMMKDQVMDDEIMMDEDEKSNVVSDLIAQKGGIGSVDVSLPGSTMGGLSDVMGSVGGTVDNAIGDDSGSSSSSEFMPRRFSTKFMGGRRGGSGLYSTIGGGW